MIELGVRRALLRGGGSKQGPSVGNLGEGGVRQLTQGLLLYPQDAPLQTSGFDLISKQAGELMMSNLAAITHTSGEG